MPDSLRPYNNKNRGARFPAEGNAGHVAPLHGSISRQFLMHPPDGFIGTILHVPLQLVISFPSPKPQQPVQPHAPETIQVHHAQVFPRSDALHRPFVSPPEQQSQAGGKVKINKKIKRGRPKSRWTALGLEKMTIIY
jgi:hypothetical protein